MSRTNSRRAPAMRRRDFIAAASAAGTDECVPPGTHPFVPAPPPINRRSLVRRHSPVLFAADPRSPLSVGNGEFAFTVDITGLQTFPAAYERGIPLCTQSQWGWHTAPNPRGFKLEDLRPTLYDTYGRQVGYPTNAERQSELFNWLRENPHRLHLGRIGLELTRPGGAPATLGVLAAIRQELDLWSGLITSRFEFDGAPVVVETCCHPELDMVAITIRSRLIDQHRLAVAFDFPYGSPQMNAADWNKPDAHQSARSSATPDTTLIRRQLDRDVYWAAIRSGSGELKQAGVHRFVLSPRQGATGLDFVCLFSPRRPAASLPDTRASIQAAANHWSRFWSTGGAVELSASADPRAKELERRVVLSQYLTAIQCAGSMPPQETGLTCNSWYGKFHLEMHWWHAAHFALWNRIHLLEKSLAWYDTILPRAQATARNQSYRGARWPKMVGPDGRESPSTIGPLLIWQQPHPLYYAELCYRAHPNHQTLDRYRRIVVETADFMASFAVYDSAARRYVLGPPVIPAQENHPPRETWNPAFELEYWEFGLGIAQRWLERLGLPRNREWDQVRAALSSLPVKDGVYLAHENCPQTYTERNRDHPSMLAALGMLPGVKADPAVMTRTLDRVLKTWRWPDTWGWDYPMIAMTAARLNNPAAAIDAFFMESPKNTWLPNGHTFQRDNLPLYLPSNGALLSAIALMTAGWESRPKPASSAFPASWQVSWENLSPAL